MEPEGFSGYNGSILRYLFVNSIEICILPYVK